MLFIHSFIAQGLPKLGTLPSKSPSSIPARLVPRISQTQIFSAFTDEEMETQRGEMAA